MKFKKVKIGNCILEYVVESAEGYVILQCRANEVPTGRVLAFFGKSWKGPMAKVIGGYDSSGDAKKACEDHFAGKHRDD